MTRFHIACTALSLLIGSVAWAQDAPSERRPLKSEQPAAPPQHVVFVCEHGAARSVIAAAYFNKLAEERHLNVRAIARGTAAQADLSTAAVAGLQRDGVAFSKEKPRDLTAQDLRGAVRVIAFCPLPASLAKQAPVASFEVPAPGDGSDGYDASRDAILVHVKALVEELASHKGLLH